MSDNMNGALTEKLFNSVIQVEKSLERHTTILETMVNELKEIKIDRVNDLRNHDERVKSLEEKVAAGSKTQWPVIFSTVGAAMTLLGMIGAVVAYAWFGDIGEISSRYDRLQEELLAHTRLLGHPEAIDEKIKGFEGHTKEKFELLGQRIDRIEERTKLLYKDGQPY